MFSSPLNNLTKKSGMQVVSFNQNLFFQYYSIRQEIKKKSKLNKKRRKFINFQTFFIFLLLRFLCFPPFKFLSFLLCFCSLVTGTRLLQYAKKLDPEQKKRKRESKNLHWNTIFNDRNLWRNQIECYDVYSTSFTPFFLSHLIFILFKHRYASFYFIESTRQWIEKLIFYVCTMHVWKGSHTYVHTTYKYSIKNIIQMYKIYGPFYYHWTNRQGIE